MADAVAREIIPAILLNAGLAWVGIRVRIVTRAGAVGGAALGALIYACAGSSAWVLLFASFLVAAASSRVGLKRKAVLGIVQEHDLRRGAASAFANCGVAAGAAVAAAFHPESGIPLLALTAALVAGASDTVASELGKAWGRRTVLVTSMKEVPPGTPGALSLEGTACGVAAAFGLALLALVGGLITRQWLWIVVAASLAGSVVESFLGATLERRGLLNNAQLNVINTGAAALVAVLIARTTTVT